MIIPQENNINAFGINRVSNKKEFDLFFKKYYTLFLSFACRYRLDAEEARDIVQDVFIAFWEQHESFTSIVAIKAFFYRSISNRCPPFLRSHVHMQRVLA